MSKFKSKIIEKVDNIKETLNQMNDGALKKAEKLKEVEKNLENIKIKVKKVALYLDDKGDYGVKIDYEIPSVKLIFDSNGKIYKDSNFYSINMLNLISLEDMKKIEQKINEASTKNKKSNL